MFVDHGSKLLDVTDELLQATLEKAGISAKEAVELVLAGKGEEAAAQLRANT